MSPSIDESPSSQTVSMRRNLFEYLFLNVNGFYERCFSRIGEQIGTRPILFIFLSFVLTGCCSLGFLRFTMINDVDRLFIPTDSQSVRDRSVVANLLPMNYSEYYLHQDYDFGRYGEVIFLANDQGDITRSWLRQELKRIYKLIQNVNVTHENRTYFYRDLCAKRMNQCVVEGDIFFRNSFWQRLNAKTLKNYLSANFYTDDDGVPHSLPFIFGSEMLLDADSGVLTARVLKLRFNLKRKDHENSSNDLSEFLADRWEQAFLQFFHHFRSVMLRSMYAVSTSIDKELESNINLDINLVFATFILMIFVATICLSVRAPFSQSPIHLSGIGVSATCLGLISGFGFCSLIGIPACSLVFVTPFLIIGVGTDDMFLIYSAYRRTKPSETTVRRLSETFRLCGSGITITSLTNVVAFLAGATTNFYGIRLFCFYTSASIGFCYIYQIMLFGSSVALYNNCINQNRHTLGFCLINRSSSVNESRRRRHQRQQCLPWKEMFICIIKPLFTTMGQVVVCSIFIVFVIFSGYGASQMRDGMKFSQLLSDTSYAKVYFDTLEIEFDLFPLVQLIVTEPIPYWRTDYQRRIEDLVRNIKQLDGMDQTLEISWLKMISYNSYDYPFDNGTKFLDIAHGLVNLFPAFQNDLVFNQTHVLVSRLYLKIGRVCYNSSDGYLIHQLRSLVEQSELPILVYSNLFKYYEQMFEVIPNIVQTFLIAIEAMYLITLIIIPDLKSVLITISTMGMILLSLIATLHTWGIQASSVMMVELVMSVGFCSDFCVHIVHAFLTANGTRKERAQQALINMGMPILCASLSSVIGILFLAFAHSYLFRTFFKTIVSLMVLGTIHALCFLPVILSLIGSNWSSHKLQAIPSNEPFPMCSTRNHPASTKTNGTSTDENSLKKLRSEPAPNAIEEEEDDQLISNSKKSEIFPNENSNTNIFT